MDETDRPGGPASGPDGSSPLSRDQLDDVVADYVDRLNAGEKLSRWKIMV